MEKLEEELHELRTRRETLYSTLYPGGEPKPREEMVREHKKEVQHHINQLHAYNETKDACMRLVGLIAQSRNVPVGEIMDEIGVEDD